MTESSSVQSAPRTCVSCGRPGAKWDLSVGGKLPVPAHKPCAEIIRATAPQGTVVTVKPSPELREEWARENARKFWEGQNKLGAALQAAGVTLPKSGNGSLGGGGS